MPAAFSVRFFVAAVCVTAWCTHASAQLEPPAPGPRQSRSEPETKSSAHCETGADEKRGAPCRPLTIHLAPPADAEAKTHQERDDRQKQSSADWWLVILTGAVAIATIALVIVTCGLVYFAWKQASDMKHTIEAARKSADATLRAAIVSEKTLDLAETPYLYASIQSTGGRLGGNREISYVIKNAGRSPGIVREVYHCPLYSEVLPGPVPFPSPQTNLLKTEFIAVDGESKPWLVQEPSGENQKGALWLVGQIRYADVFGNQFISDFCLYSFGAGWNAAGGAGHNSRRKLTSDELVAAEQRDLTG